MDQCCCVQAGVAQLTTSLVYSLSAFHLFADSWVPDSLLRFLGE